MSALSSAANALLGYAFAQGLAISFWRRASRGTTVRVLLAHRRLQPAPETSEMSMQLNSTLKLGAVSYSYEAHYNFICPATGLARAIQLRSVR